MKPEAFFLKFAFPCAFIAKQRGEITEEEHELLQKAAISGDALDRRLLERIFHNAFDKIKIIAEKSGKDRWDIDVIKDYFYTEHNRFLCAGKYIELPGTLRELCKVHEAVVKEKREDVLIVEYKGKRRPVMDHLVPEAKVGDKVRIHYGYAVEKVD